MMMRQGSIVDATLIAAPNSTNNMEGRREPEMHQTKKGNQWYYGMKVLFGVDNDSGLIHSVDTTVANAHDLSKDTEVLHSDEAKVYADAGYEGIAKRPEMESTSAEFRIAMGPDKDRVLPDTPDGKLQGLIEAAKAHIHAKVEYSFRVIKQQFGFQKTRLRGMAKNRCKANVIAAHKNVFLARHLLVAEP